MVSSLLLHTVSESVVLTSIVIMLMMMIEFIHIHTRGNWITKMDKNPYGQILLASLLGATPGCVGVFAVVSLYTHNIVGFGALLAACIASFGDEAFFLFSQAPSTGAITLCLLWGTGFLAGCAYHLLKPFQSTNDPHQMEHLVLHEETHHPHTEDEHARHATFYRLLLILYTLLFMLSLVFGWIGEPGEKGTGIMKGASGENLVFLCIAACVLFVLCMVDGHFLKEHLWKHILKKHLLKVFLWTFGVLLAIGLLEMHLDLTAFSQQNSGKILLLGLAIVIGLIPQSGPHLAIIQLFMSGIIPYSTLLANCLLQEGHGGIPLLAESPRIFFKLKALKMILALLVGIAGLLWGW